jgi:hypothetical protein
MTPWDSPILAGSTPLPTASWLRSRPWVPMVPFPKKQRCWVGTWGGFFQAFASPKKRLRRGLRHLRSWDFTQKNRTWWWFHVVSGSLWLSLLVYIIYYNYCCCYWDLIWGFLTTCQGLFTATPLHRGPYSLFRKAHSLQHPGACARDGKRAGIPSAALPGGVMVHTWAMAAQDLFNLFNLPKKASLEPLASWYSICILDGL